MAWDDVVVAHVTKHLAANYNSMVTYIKGHKTQHENGGVDEISVAGLSGQLADGQTPLAHKTSHQDGGTDEINVTGLAGQLADGQPTISHKTNHQNGGTDEISVAGLSGQLADGQTPIAHAATHATGSTDVITILMAQVTGLVAALAGKEPVITPKNTAFNKDYGTTSTDVKMNGTQGVGATDAIARIDHIHPQDTSRLAVHANVTAINGDGIANGEIAVFNLTNKDIRTSDKTIVTTIGSDDTTVPTSKAVVDATIAQATNVTAINDTGIADGEIAVFNLSAKDIRTSDKTIVTTIGSDDTTVPTSKAVVDSTIAKATNVTAINDAGIADGEIALFNLSNKDIRTSDTTIVTTLGATDATIPTSKAVKTVTDLLAPIADPTFTGVPAAPTATDGTSTTQIATTEYVETAIVDRPTSTSVSYTIYVDAAATGAADGTSWTDAFTKIQDAVDSLPLMVNHLVYIKIRKAAGNYDDGVVTISRNGQSIIYFLGEYYWKGANASSKTGKFDLDSSWTGYSDRAQIEAGDIVFGLKWSGTHGTSKPTDAFEDTVASVSDTEVTLTTNTTKAVDTTWAFRIVKTKIVSSGSNNIFTVSPSNITHKWSGLYMETQTAVMYCIYGLSTRLELNYCYFKGTTRVVYAGQRSQFAPNSSYFVSSTNNCACLYTAASYCTPSGCIFNLTGTTSSAIYTTLNSEMSISYDIILAATYGLQMSGPEHINYYPTLCTNSATNPTYGAGFWSAYTPTLTWTTGTPASVTTIARWSKTGTTMFFTIDISSADANGCTGLTITLPATVLNSGNNIPCSAIQLNDTTYLNPLAYIQADGSNNKINFKAFATVADTKAVKIWVSGQYEVTPP